MKISPTESGDTDRIAVVVLGMHRSGTSAVSGALRLLGVDFGDKLMPPNADNMTGYWEHPEIVQLHDRLLSSLQMAWSDDRPLPDGWTGQHVTSEVQSEIIALLRRDFAGSRVIGIKDPRMSRLLPMWFRIFALLRLQPRFVLVIRHPWEVAQSLARRDGIAEAHSYLLWLQYTIEAFMATRGRRRAMVHYEEVIEQPVQVLSRVRRSLGLPIAPPSSVRGPLRDFLSPALRHHRSSGSGDHRPAIPLPSIISDAYETLCGSRRSRKSETKLSLLSASLRQSAELFYPRLAACQASSAPVTQSSAQCFSPRQGFPREECSAAMAYSPGSWKRLHLDLPWGLGDASVPLRFDPASSAGIVDLAALSLRSAATGEILWRASTRAGLENLRTNGTCVRLPHPRIFRLWSYGDDPQIHLPLLAGERFEEPLALEAWLRFDPAPEALAAAMGLLERHVAASMASPLSTEATAPPTALPDRSHPMLVVYAADESGYGEDRALRIPYQYGRWSHLHIALEHGLGLARLRFDPLEEPGLIDLAGVMIRSAVTGDVLWKANGDGGLNVLEPGGDAVKIPHERLVRVFSYGEDPQIYLPQISGPVFDGPLGLELWLKVDAGFKAIGAGLGELVRTNARLAAKENETQALLEETTQDASEKDVQVQALRTAVEDAEQDAADRLDYAEAVHARAVAACQETSAKLRLELEGAHQELADVRAALTARSGELQAAIGGAASRDAALAAHTTENDLLRQRVADAEGVLAAQAAELEEAANELGSTRARVITLEGELQAARDRLAAAQDQLAARTAELQRVRAELENRSHPGPADKGSGVHEQTNQVQIG